MATFGSTQSAMEAEEACQEDGVAGRLIPTPVAIRATCGLSWSMAPEGREAFERTMEAHGVAVESIQELEL